MNKTTLSLGLGTLLVFGMGGILVIELLQDERFVEVLLRGRELPYQLLIGLLVGLTASGIALYIISRKFFEKEKAFYYGLISRLDLDVFAMVFLSLCAGVGEEIFFRAGIQPFLGIWWTALLFVLLHGYLNPTNFKISIYGIVMVGFIAVFGYLFQYIGIFSAITAHAVFDMVLFLRMTKSQSFWGL